MTNWIVGASVLVEREGGIPATILEVRPGNLFCRLEDGRSMWIPEQEVSPRVVGQRRSSAQSTSRSDAAARSNAPATFAAPTDNPYAAPRTAFEPSGFAGDAQGDRNLSWLLFSFEGRIGRGEFWRGTLIVSSLFVALGISFAIVALQFSRSIEEFLTSGAGIALFIAVLILFLPAAWIGFALNVKRWHDRNKSGVWMLIQLVPYIGGIWAFIETGCLRGTVGPNRFGPDPLARS